MPDISKVNLNGNTLMDVTQDTVNSGNLLAGETATMNNGSKTVGTVSLDGYALKTMLAPVEASTTAAAAHTAGEFLIHNDALYIATRNIAIGDTFSSSNTEEVKTADELDGLYQSVANSIGAYYEPTTIASRNYSGARILVRGYGLYTADLTAGDDITNHPTSIMINLYDVIDAIGAALATKANIASPTFTGTPKAPTAASGTNNTQIATTEFVQDAITTKANLASPAFTGTPTAPTAASGTNTTQIATTEFVNDAIENRLVVNPNLIRNWYFIGGGSQQGNGQLPINRNNKTTYTTSGAETIDGFSLYGSAPAQVTVESDGIVLESLNTDSTYTSNLGQYICGTENLPTYTALTFSVLVTEYTFVQKSGTTDGYARIELAARTSANSTTVKNATITGPGLYSVTYNHLNNTPKDYEVDICNLRYAVQGTRIKIAACKLEIGNNQTLAHQDSDGNWHLNEIPNFNDQLIRCESAPILFVSNYNKQYNQRSVHPAMTAGMISNPNLLRNAIFATNGTNLPVNSKGQTTYVGGGIITADGWFLRNSSGGDGSGQPRATLQETGLDLYCDGATHGNLQGFHQNVNDFQSLAGKTVTLSILIISNTSTGTRCDFGVWNSTSAGTNNTTITDSIVNIVESTGLVTKTFTMPDSFTNSYLNVGIFPSSNSDIQMRIAAIKMELGDTQTLAHMVNGKWVLNEYPNYSEEAARCLTSTANTSDTNSGFEQVFGKLNASGNPYLRFYTNDGNAYQFVTAADTSLKVQRYDGSTWSDVSIYYPSDYYMSVDSEYTTINPWPGSTYYYKVLTAPTGYEFVSANITRFSVSDGVMPSLTLGANRDSVYLMKPTSVTFASNAKVQVRALLKKSEVSS